MIPEEVVDKGGCRSASNDTDHICSKVKRIKNSDSDGVCFHVKNMVGNYANLSKHVTAHLNHSDDFLHI
jgi:hypothetical protein